LEEKSYDLLYKINKETGDYKTSVKMLELFHRIKDSAKVEATKNELERQGLKYSYEKKELNYKLATEKKNASKNILLLILLSALILLSIGAYFLYRNNKQKQAIANFEKNDLKQKLLLTQMNPHFIFNSIDNIQSLIHHHQNQEAINYLAKFSKLTRQILENSNENFITLAEELVMIENYLSIQQLLYNNHFNFTITVAESIDADAILIPPMLTQPFIENAIKHGLIDQSEGLISIHFKLEHAALLFEITDNGVGFGTSKKVGNNKSLAMKITRERLKNFSKKDNFEVHTQNIHDTHNNITGAKVFFEIPYLYEN
jgi:LytS/YehU family sensor histidine kinase